MRKRIVSIAPAIGLVAAMIALLIIAACSRGGGKREDTLVIEPETTATLPAEEMVDARINSRGIGPIRRGMRIVDIQPRVENLYDTIMFEGGYDSNSYSFFLDGRQRFTVYEFESGVANVIVADDSSIVVQPEDAESLRLGDPFRRVLELKDVKPVWEAADDEGMWCWTWQGLWFQPDQQHLNDALVHKLYNSSAAPTAADFADDITIGYIGTGLTW